MEAVNRGGGDTGTRRNGEVLMKILKRILQITGILVGAVILYLLVVALIPGFPQPKQPLPPSETIAAKPSPFRKDVNFDVHGTPVSAWLYMPPYPTEPAPCIVMAHGFGGTKNMGLEPYAVRFFNAGFAVLVFDYRHLGESGGEPRQLIWVPYQLEDWEAAVAYARTIKNVNPSKIALWGTSFSGGHVIVTAAKDREIACISSQCPALDGRASAELMFEKVGIRQGLQLLMHGQRDIVRSWLGLSPHKIPIVGKPGTIACLTTEDAVAGYAGVATPGFINETCARIIVRADKYRPVEYAGDIACPVLLQICDKDSLTPLSAALETEQQLGEDAEAIHYPIGHFEIYQGEHFEKSVQDQLVFFNTHLR